jgi:phage regulator Rha-like protein
MFDKDLAVLYEVKTKELNKAVSRNKDRFPDDFVFQLTKEESLRFQIGTLKRGQHRKYLPYVFTEQGVAMLSAVLKSKRAIAVSIQIVRTFVRLREILLTNKQLRDKIEQMERKYDKKFNMIFKVIAQLMKEDAVGKNEIGFK